MVDDGICQAAFQRQEIRPRQGKKRLVQVSSKLVLADSDQRSLAAEYREYGRNVRDNFITLPSPSRTVCTSNQRASADTKRGKRRRPLVEGAAQATAESGEGSARDNTGSVVQVVPSKAVVPPVVKVKEERRKKRLLRNRVSAQQARERKRHHINDLEENCNIIEKKNQHLEERMNTLMKENEELRQIVKGNMRSASGGGSNTNGGPAMATDFSRSMVGEISRPRAEVPRAVDMYGYGMVSPMVQQHPQQMSYGGHEQGMYMQNNGGHIHS